MNKPPQNGISLTCAVVLVLAGVFLLGVLSAPYLASRRPPPRFHPRLTCQSHLRQLQYAALAYAQDYDDRFPRRPSPGGDWMVWKWSALKQPDSRSFRPIGTDDGPLAPYTRNYRIIACPDDSSQQPEERINVPHSSYTWNNALCGKLAKDVPNDLLVWDRAPFHDRGRNLITVSGERAVWVAEKDFAPLLAK